MRNLLTLSALAIAAVLTCRQHASVGQELLPLSGTIVNGIRVVDIRADRASVSPLVIVVAQGERVRLVIHSRDIIHSLRVDAQGVDVTISPGATARVDLRADQSGQFAMVWNACCSPDWPALGQLVVLSAQ